MLPRTPPVWAAVSVTLVCDRLEGASENARWLEKDAKGSGEASATVASDLICGTTSIRAADEVAAMRWLDGR